MPFKKRWKTQVRLTWIFNTLFNFCFSLDRANVTNNEQQQGEVNCQNVNTDTVEINLWNACEGHSLIHYCPPLFISVEGSRIHDGQNLRCSERECRFPDSARFEIITDNLGCFNSAGNFSVSLMLLLVSLTIIVKF